MESSPETERRILALLPVIIITAVIQAARIIPAASAPPGTVHYTTPERGKAAVAWRMLAGKTVFGTIREYSGQRFSAGSAGRKVPVGAERIFVSAGGIEFRRPMALRETETLIEENLYGRRRTLVSGRKDYYDKRTGQLLHSEYAFTDGTAPQLTVCEWTGSSVKVVVRRADADKEFSQIVDAPRGAFIAGGFDYVDGHFRRWKFPPGTTRKFRPFSVELARFVEVSAERLADEAVTVHGTGSEVEIPCRVYHCEVSMPESGAVFEICRLYYRSSEDAAPLLVKRVDSPAGAASGGAVTEWFPNAPRFLETPEPVSLKPPALNTRSWWIPRDTTFKYVVFSKGRQFGNVEFQVQDNSDTGGLRIIHSVKIETGAGKREEHSEAYFDRNYKPVSVESRGTVCSEETVRYHNKTLFYPDGKTVISSVTVLVPDDNEPDASLDEAEPRRKVFNLAPGLFPVDFNSVGLVAFLFSQLPWKSPAAGEVGLFQARAGRVMRLRYTVAAVDLHDGRERRRFEGRAMGISMSALVRKDGIVDEWTVGDRFGNALKFVLAGDSGSKKEDRAERRRKFPKFIRPADW